MRAMRTNPRRRWAASLGAVLALTLGGALDARADSTSSAKVTLISAGKGAKRALRFSVKPGQKQQIKLVMEMEMAMAMGEMRMPAVKAPVSEITMDTEVTKVEAGRIRYRFSFSDVRIIDDAGLPAAAVTQMKAGMDGMKGVKGFAEVDETGRTFDADFSTDGTLEPQMAEMLENVRNSLNSLTAPFPIEPVGLGAKWTVEMTANQMGFALTQVATYELTNLKGDVGTLKVGIKQSASNSELKLPNLPPEAKARLVSMDSGGGGDVQFTLRKLGPARATTKVKSNMKMEIEASGQHQVMEMDMNMTIKMTSAK